MKVLLAVLLVAVFWSQEWKSALSDSIIHIGKLLRFFLSLFLSLAPQNHSRSLCASVRKQTGGFSTDKGAPA